MTRHHIDPLDAPDRAELALISDLWRAEARPDTCTDCGAPIRVPPWAGKRCGTCRFGPLPDYPPSPF